MSKKYSVICSTEHLLKLSKLAEGDVKSVIVLADWFVINQLGDALFYKNTPSDESYLCSVIRRESWESISEIEILEEKS